MKNLIILFAVVLLASCTTQRGAEGFFNKNQAEAAAYCAARFPDQESVVVRENITIDTQFFETPPSGFVIGGDGVRHNRAGFSLDKNGNAVFIDDSTRGLSPGGLVFSGGDMTDGVVRHLDIENNSTKRTQIRDKDAQSGFHFGKPDDLVRIQTKTNCNFDMPNPYKDCPPSMVITRTISRDTTKTKIDGALLASLRFQVGDELKKREAMVGAHQKEIVKKDAMIKALQEDIKKVKAQRNKLLWILFVIAGGVGVWLFIKLRSKIPIAGRP